ncbi:efflux RND transporter periplasmic adaptor subunit [Aliikangiella coralliicola]|uniref:HlyD family efflux transporter periplasmic adaptor subunit n=1 Tax=Aliikangiella coralliicola TaxID=2592383 RepID=A0A545UJJ9_9GAMM|nr:HlyD family efflux transporter periplasmic adaptor subunit [Aliikangiella coralliicola]TQV89648.1 HlyD family efflux transporter periplasmic adaptor subunit [Aliikangiella coralliicola]
MDKRIEGASKKRRLKLAIGTTIAFVLIMTAYSMREGIASGQTQKINAANITVSEVIQGRFEDTLNVRGTVTPKTSIYLDSVSGGRVEERLVEQGSYVEKGQPLIRLSNASLQLDVISREAQISEQLNFLRNTQMLAETNRLNLRRELIENENQIAHLNRKIKKVAQLAAKNFFAKDELAMLQQDLHYYQQRKALNLERQQQEDKLRKIQLAQLKDSAEMLQNNLAFARKNLASLLVRAPVSGTLSELNVVTGESKNAGARLGQIDLPDEYKLLASLDEYYLNQANVGMPVKIKISDTTIDAQIDKIDSRVINGQFTIEVNFPILDKAQDHKVKRGQSLDLEITLDTTSKQSLLISRGSFINSSGGNWAYVLDADGSMATKRSIKLGKKNQQYYQVLSGLGIGEHIITSSYSAFDKAETLTIN